MDIFGAKAFVRKFPAGSARGTERPTTMILMLVEGDVPSFSDESLHGLQVCDIEGTVQLTVVKAEPTESFAGYRADQIITAL